MLLEEALILTQGSWRYATSLANDVEDKCGILDLIHRYAEAILWFLNSGLLPETDEYIYPARELQAVYSSKRKQLKTKLLEWTGSHQLSAEDVGKIGLLVDGLSGQLGSQLFVRAITTFGRKCIP